MHRLYENGVGQGELGYVYVLDWETKELVVKPQGVQPDYSLYTPMGRSHGCRGITIHDGKLYVASSGSDISVFDLDTYQRIERLTFPSMRHLHQIKSHDGFLYACSTGTDRLYKIKNDKVEEETYLDVVAPYVDSHIPQEWVGTWGRDRLHFNSVAWNSSGDECHVYFGARMIFNFTQKKVLYAHGVLHCPHDLLFASGGYFACSSTDKAVYFFQDNGIIRCVNKNFDIAPPGTPNAHGFTHGLAMGDGLLFSCSSPTKIRSFDLGNFELKDTLYINDNPNECIYDLVLDPRDWRIP